MYKDKNASILIIVNNFVCQTGWQGIRTENVCLGLYFCDRLSEGHYVSFSFLQIVFVSVGAGRQPRKMDGSIPSASLPIPPRDKLPMMLLNQEPFFGQLLTMLEKLSRLDLATLMMVCDFECLCRS
jgi:hypothetical protein